MDQKSTGTPIYHVLKHGERVYDLISHYKELDTTLETVAKNNPKLFPNGSVRGHLPVGTRILMGYRS